MRRQWLLTGLMLPVFFPFHRAHATIILERASLGQTGFPGGFGVNNGQFWGARFATAQDFIVTDLRIHAGGFGSLFFAINPLNPITNFPNSLTLNDAVFAGLINFPPSAGFNNPALSDELSLSTNFLLPAGNYSVIAGSGLFGATGAGFAPDNNTDIGIPSSAILPPSETVVSIAYGSWSKVS